MEFLDVAAEAEEVEVNSRKGKEEEEEDCDLYADLETSIFQRSTNRVTGQKTVIRFDWIVVKYLVHLFPIQTPHTPLSLVGRFLKF